MRLSSIILSFSLLATSVLGSVAKKRPETVGEYAERGQRLWALLQKELINQQHQDKPILTPEQLVAEQWRPQKPLAPDLDAVYNTGGLFQALGIPTPLPADKFWGYIIKKDKEGSTRDEETAYKNYVAAEHGILLAGYNSRADAAHYHWSDVAMTLWTQATATTTTTPRTKLQWVFRDDVFNLDTKNIATAIKAGRDPGAVEIFQPGTYPFFALLGSENGLGVVYLLLDYASALGRRTVKSIGIKYHAGKLFVWFEIGDHHEGGAAATTTNTGGALMPITHQAISSTKGAPSAPQLSVLRQGQTSGGGVDPQHFQQTPPTKNLFSRRSSRGRFRRRGSEATVQRRRRDLHRRYHQSTV